MVSALAPFWVDAHLAWFQWLITNLAPRTLPESGEAKFGGEVIGLRTLAPGRFLSLGMPQVRVRTGNTWLSLLPDRAMPVDFVVACVLTLVAF